MPHWPALHVAAPFVELQTVPQAPQWPASPLRFTSQPFVGSLSQSANPGLQVIPHRPAVQVAVPFVELQAVPQAPQWSGSVSRFDSHPVATFASQSANPVLQAIAQVPASQLGVPFVLEQALPQEPQWARSVASTVSHPFEFTPSQSENPGSHVIPHALLVQLAVPFAIPH